MLILKECPFYRETENLAMGKGLGHCDLGGIQALCEGDVKFCDNPDDLKRQLLEQKKDDTAGNRENEDRQKRPPIYRVLVVDDEEPIRKLVAALLSSQGHQCATAGSGAEALGKINRTRFDAAISDIVMPEMNGIALTKELLSLYPGMPIMIMTGYSKEYPTDLAIAAGARDFIGKPFSNHELILRFNKMMRDQETFRRMKAKQNEMFLQSRS
jgi:CheY-like chemotaxis protein